MCGIAGVLVHREFRPAEDEELRRMIAMLRHRGPDGWGTYRSGPIALGHARLAITGVADGHQPLCNEDASVWVSGNGEIFNHIELRRELEDRGHRFRTGSDTEVAVHAYEEWGEEAWRRFNGQFALAVWDDRRRHLHLVRDGFGILPLFWARVGRAIVFASEAKAIFAGGRLAPEFDPAGVAQAFTRWSATAPDTVFVGLRGLRPGAALVIDDSLEVVERTHWQPRIVSDPSWRGASLDDAAAALGAALDRAVRLRLRADVPVGCYVSGGIDSSVITALASRAAGRTLDSFAVRFTDPTFDETAEQRLVAELQGTRHHEILCDGQDIGDSLPDVVWHCEAPLLRTAPAPLFRLSRLVRDAGRKVVLTGEGADELLAGYSIFKEDRVRRFWARQPNSRMRAQLLRRLHPYIGAARARDTEQWQRFFADGLTSVEDPFYSHAIRWRNSAWGLRFLAPDWRAGNDLERITEGLVDHLPQGWRDWEPLARAQAIEITTFMSSYLLCSQGDRVAMAHGVEVRYPFLDPDFVDLCCALPQRVKLLGLRDKLALRRFARGMLPDAITKRPKKPYRAPGGSRLLQHDWVVDALGEQALRRFGLVDPKPTLRLVDKVRRSDATSEREEMALVGVATMQVLVRQYQEELPGRVLRARSALDAVLPTVATAPQTAIGEA